MEHSNIHVYLEMCLSNQVNFWWEKYTFRIQTQILISYTESSRHARYMYNNGLQPLPMYKRCIHIQYISALTNLVRGQSPSSNSDLNISFSTSEVSKESWRKFWNNMWKCALIIIIIRYRKGERERCGIAIDVPVCSHGLCPAKWKWKVFHYCYYYY